MKSYLVYIIVFLMFSTSALYFLAAILGKNLEGGEAHGLQVVQGQEDETLESVHNETEEEHDEASESPEQQEVELEAQEQAGEEKHTEREAIEEEHDEASENQRRNLEFPLFIGAGVGYAAVGLWMILDKRNGKIPYIIAIVGSLVLLALYFSSRTVGIYNLGTEPFGVFDSTVAAIQIAIIASSSYVVYRKYIKGITVDK